jgi:hypothetical protein
MAAAGTFHSEKLLSEAGVSLLYLWYRIRGRIASFFLVDCLTTG